ncbi:MAG: response regulator transcription factor [Actinomycetes bacterium]
MIDDEPDLLQLCRIALEGTGHQVTTAESAEEGLAVTVTAEPDVIVLDFMMPKTDGLTVLERLHRDVDPGGRVPVLMLSARGRPEDALRGLAAGATAYMTKPFSFDELEDLLIAIVDESPAERDLRRTRALAALTTDRGGRPVR